MLGERKYYVIRKADNDQLYWCVKNGWVEAPHETFFTEQERMELRLPANGVWVLTTTTTE